MEEKLKASQSSSGSITLSQGRRREPYLRLNHGVRAQRDIAGKKDFQLRTPASANHSNSFISTLKKKKIYQGSSKRNFTWVLPQHLPCAQLLSHVQLFVTPWTTACQASLSITNSQSLLKLLSIESMIASNHLIPCHPLLLLPSIFHSIRVFPKESVLHIRWPKYWSFSISPSNEYSGLTSFRIDWFDLLAVQGHSQESSPTPQFKSINSWALSFLKSPSLTFIHDY